MSAQLLPVLFQPLLTGRAVHLFQTGPAVPALPAELVQALPLDEPFAGLQRVRRGRRLGADDALAVVERPLLGPERPLLADPAEVVAALAA